MGKVDDLINSVGVGEDGVTLAYPETFLADISAAAADDMSIPVAKISVLEAEKAALEQENLLLKAHNYELITMLPSSDASADSETSDSDSDSDSDDVSEEDVTVDDLFDEPEK